MDGGREVAWGASGQMCACMQEKGSGKDTKHCQVDTDT
jgi:hypothetical protein